MHKDQKLFSEILKLHQQQLHELQGIIDIQVRELNLQMIFVMNTFRFSKDAPLVGLDGRREKIIESLGQRYDAARESLLQRLEALDADGKSDPKSEGAAPVVAEGDAEVVNELDANNPTGLTH